jgi:hypothetical protein
MDKRGVGSPGPRPQIQADCYEGFVRPRMKTVRLVINKRGVGGSPNPSLRYKQTVMKNGRTKIETRVRLVINNRERKAQGPGLRCRLS